MCIAVFGRLVDSVGRDSQVQASLESLVSRFISSCASKRDILVSRRCDPSSEARFTMACPDDLLTYQNRPG